MGPLTARATNTTDTEVDSAIGDAKRADQEFLYGTRTVLADNTNSNTLEDNPENSDLDIASNLSSSTDTDTEQKEPICRSKRLTKTNPIVRYNYTVCHDYRKHHKKTELGGHTESSEAQPEREDKNP